MITKKYTIKIQFLFILILVSIIGCTTNTKDTITYFGGEIINSKSQHVLLYDNDKVIDTIPVKEDNTFLGKFVNLPTGLYYFEHEREIQKKFLILELLKKLME